jgi:hypothetical protein
LGRHTHDHLLHVVRNAIGFQERSQPADQAVVIRICAEDEQVRAGGDMLLVKRGRPELLFCLLVRDYFDLPRLDVQGRGGEPDQLERSLIFASGIFLPSNFFVAYRDITISANSISSAHPLLCG